MVVKVYISGMSGSKEVKKRQQRVTMIMDSKHIEYSIIDITEPGQEGEKDFMQTNAAHKGCTISDPNPRHALPPQLFNDTEYCGDYDDFDLANEVDNLEVFLKVAPPPAPVETTEHKNGEAAAAADDENKENKTEANKDDNDAAADGEDAAAGDAVDGPNEVRHVARGDGTMEADGSDSEEQEMLRASAAALAGQSEDAQEEIIEVDDEPLEEAEEEISSKLIDTDDPMLAEQEQEE
ncbi:SH3 domain-binding glutamic acid-rich protein homolog isoform X1 [Anopheles cruzii]|uniref:SH3 domain-binding glutamic acid-rich protein homolog isoform X1 n=1 Tax=Anopheles cruzii TaxID=68878 RepID=UPI0022EC97A6|nr:SH3 domain-binding glutamic acid-rich protein homolog isoform X1 [Anopheles cruzii]XP_052861938.1 SH3 domain-binding glutamic acid-rich protein homolog isoform X1 [Anopheles cruzii]